MTLTTKEIAEILLISRLAAIPRGSDVYVEQGRMAVIEQFAAALSKKDGDFDVKQFMRSAGYNL